MEKNSSNLSPLLLTQDMAISLNFNLRLLTYGKYCLRQVYDVDNSIAYNTYACDYTTCDKCLKEWIDKERMALEEKGD